MAVLSTMNQPFRFLDLPMELRLMVYEHLPITEIRATIKEIAHSALSKDPEAIAVLIHYTMPLAILATCQSIFAEAAPILFKRRDLTVSGPQLLISHKSPAFLHRLEGVLNIFHPNRLPFRAGSKRIDDTRIEVGVQHIFREYAGEDVQAVCNFAKRALKYWNFADKKIPRYLSQQYEVVNFGVDQLPEPASPDQKAKF